MAPRSLGKSPGDRGHCGARRARFSPGCALAAHLRKPPFFDIATRSGRLILIIMTSFASPETVESRAHLCVPVSIRASIASRASHGFGGGSSYSLSVAAPRLPAEARTTTTTELRPRVPITSDSPDEDLTLAACGGNTRATALIWRRYAAQVRSRLMRWIGSDDLEDHVQEVFSRLFENLSILRQPSALRSFLVGIALRVACNELRRRRRWRVTLTATGDLSELIQYSTSDDAIAREALNRFDAILRRLTPRARRVFELRYIEGLELVDVAGEMDISLATAKRHLSRASSRVFAMAFRDPALIEYTSRAPCSRPDVRLQAVG